VIRGAGAVKGWEMTQGVLIRDKSRGFTMIEFIAVLVVVGILAAIVVVRATNTASTNRISRTNVIKNHIRYAQAMAMKQGAVWGIKCDSMDYWLFRTVSPDSTANQRPLPGEDDAKIPLSAKDITMTAFTVFFDAVGRPYTAYANPSSNSPVSVANPLSITVDSVPGGSPATIQMTPETGFLP